MWSVFQKALYIQGHVFNSSSMFPHGIEHAWWTMLEKHSLHIWKPEAEVLVDVTDAERVEAMLAEKDEALTEIGALVKRLHVQGKKLLQFPKVCRVDDILPLFERYIEGFVRCGKVVILAKAISKGLQASKYQNQLVQSLKELEKYRKWLSSWTKETSYSHQLYMLMDSERIASVISDAHKLSTGITGSTHKHF
jgi:hypothetical protein